MAALTTARIHSSCTVEARKRANTTLNLPLSEIHISLARSGQNTLKVSCKMDPSYHLLTVNLSSIAGTSKGKKKKKREATLQLS